MTERYINLENTYTIIPENTQESDKKRQILISKKLNGSVYNKLDIKEYQKNNFNQVFITDKINFFSLVKLLIIKKNKLYSYNLELNSLSYKALTEYFVEDILTTNYFYKIFKTYLFDIIKIFFYRLNFYLSDTICILPSQHRIKFFKDNLKINCKYICIKNMPISSDLYNEKFNLPFNLSNNIKKIINSKNYFFLNGNVNNKPDLIKLLKYCNQKKIYLLISTKQKRLINNIDKNLSKNFINVGYIKDKALMYFIISNSLAGVCFYNNRTLNQKYSSSSKFYDFIVYQKSIIHSDNYGIKKEIEFIKKLNSGYNFYNINLLNSDKEIFDKVTKDINQNFIFDNYYKNLDISQGSEY